MKKKISLKEKIRRQNQASDGTKYLDGAGGTFTMSKEKDGWCMDRSHYLNDDGTLKESVSAAIDRIVEDMKNNKSID